MPKQLRRTDLLKLAREGAQARLRDLERQVDALHKAFPGLRSTRRTSAGPVALKQPRRHPVWTPAMRKAAADRMHKYWASARKKTSKK